MFLVPRDTKDRKREMDVGRDCEGDGCALLGERKRQQDKKRVKLPGTVCSVRSTLNIVGSSETTCAIEKSSKHVGA